ncbi:RrF2 family transcriptional regulator [Pleomorphomonas oryzae]|uniref:RrF2 family transcriptional regulator n=1 Tax=Pleomorphomonas oryzae TaxID=261934 RepID=UPI0004156D7F|nr:Rrf2 family transcriptional regulator [Pleomorphomonas oryzae]
MRLTSYSNYSLRVLLAAAARSPRLTTIREVAEAFDLPQSHLVKCVHQLGTWGYLETVRGNGGGFRLKKSAASIPLGEVVRRTEDGLSVVECLDPETNTCPLVDRCRMSLVLRRATDAFLDVLDRLTLADVAGNEAEFRALLDEAGPAQSVSAVICGSEAPVARA